MKQFILIICGIFFCFLSAEAQPGSLDNTFGIGGKVTTDFGSSGDEGLSVAIQNDDKIVVAGWSNDGTDYDFALVRYNSDGTLDNTFSSDGKVITPIGSYGDFGYSIIIQTDGKIVIAGSSSNGTDNDFALVRYNTDGSLDNTFSSDGKVTTDFGSNYDNGNSVAIQTDGKIAVAGFSYNGTDNDFALVRYNTDGSLDTTFGSGGKVTTSIGSFDDKGWSVTVQNDGKIVVAGYSDNGSDRDFALARYNTNGTLDNTFGSGGKVITDFGSSDDAGHSISIQNDDKIIVAGESNNGSPNYIDFALVRYNSDGTLDNAFGSGGKVTTNFGSDFDWGNSVVIQSDGKIVVVGVNYNGSNRYFAIIRYNSNGSLDNTFGSGGKVSTDFGNAFDWGNSVSIQNDGKIVVAGESWNGSGYDFAVARYNNDFCSTIIFSQSPSICNGDSIQAGNNIYKTTGVYIDTLVAVNGCDSVVTTNLTVNPAYADTQNVTINNGDSVQVGSHIYTTTGTYVDTLTASNGCDSIVTTNLNVITGISSLTFEKVGIKIEPNPFSDVATLSVHLPDGQAGGSGFRVQGLEFRMYDLLGREVYKSLILNPQSQIHRGNLPGGMYFYKLTDKEKILATGKIVIQ